MIRVSRVPILGLVLAAALASACDDRSDGAEAPVASTQLDLGGYRLVDLSYAYDDATLYWPTSPSGFESETLWEGYTEAGFYYLAKRFASPEHGGTHLDAPVHFAEHGWSVEEIPLERLLAPAVVIDIRPQAAEDADYRLTVEDVEGFEATHGPIEAGSAVLLHTGWGVRWGNADAYFGRPAGGEPLDLHFPSFGADAARLLVEGRRVGLLGVDTASIDFGQSDDFIVHQIANGANVPGLENVAHLEQLPATGAWIVALPMKIAGGSGAPVRNAGLRAR